jgi:Tfp pilus assembly protein PilV
MPIKAFTRLRNEDGFNIIEVMFASAIVIVTMFVTIQYQLTQTNLLKAAEKRNTATYQLEDVRMAMSTQTSCTNNLQNLDMSTPNAQPLTVLNFFENGGTKVGVALQVGQAHNGLTPTAINVIPGQMIGTDVMMGSIEVHSKGADTGASDLVRSVPVKMWLAAGKVQKCIGSIEFSASQESSSCTLDADGKCIALKLKNMNVTYGSAISAKCPTGWVLNRDIPEACGTYPPPDFVMPPPTADEKTFTSADGDTQWTSGADKVTCNYNEDGCDCAIRSDLSPLNWQAYAVCKPSEGK